MRHLLSNRSDKLRRNILCHLRSLIVGVALALMFSSIPAAANYQIEIYGGTSYTQQTSLHIQQEGYPDRTLHAVRYTTRPFEAPPYYGIRVARYWTPQAESIFNRFGAEVEMIHDKIHLEEAQDPDSIVQRFKVTDGLNYLVLNFVANKQLDGLWETNLRTGLAIVISHPETVIRDEADGEDGDIHGYRYSGLGAHLSLNISRQVTQRSNVMVEYKFTGANPSVPIADGKATTPVLSHHVVAGWSWRF